MNSRRRQWWRQRRQQQQHQERQQQQQPSDSMSLLVLCLVLCLLPTCVFFTLFTLFLLVVSRQLSVALFLFLVRLLFFVCHSSK